MIERCNKRKNRNGERPIIIKDGIRKIRTATREGDNVVWSVLGVEGSWGGYWGGRWMDLSIDID
jgi:hypothetical protein